MYLLEPCFSLQSTLCVFEGGRLGWRSAGVDEATSERNGCSYRVCDGRRPLLLVSTALDRRLGIFAAIFTQWQQRATTFLSVCGCALCFKFARGSDQAKCSIFVHHRQKEAPQLQPRIADGDSDSELVASHFHLRSSGRSRFSLFFLRHHIFPTLLVDHPSASFRASIDSRPILIERCSRSTLVSYRNRLGPRQFKTKDPTTNAC